MTMKHLSQWQVNHTDGRRSSENCDRASFNFENAKQRAQTQQTKLIADFTHLIINFLRSGRTDPSSSEPTSRHGRCTNRRMDERNVQTICRGKDMT